MANTLTGTTIHGWNVGEAINKWWRGKFVALYRLRKPCAQCGTEMVLDVTKSAVIGTARNSGLHLTRCSGCRDAARSEGATSRPTTAMSLRVPAKPAEEGELERLRMANKIMTEELDGLYADVKALKAQLSGAALPAKYEPPKTYTLPKPPLTMAESTERLLAAAAVINGKPKVPWE